MYFFTPRNRKYPNGSRPDRVTGSGYWKATGTDKLIKFQDRVIGKKKPLVFYQGSHKKGIKTNWLMQEYTLELNNRSARSNVAATEKMRLDEYVLCKVYSNEKPRQNPPAQTEVAITPNEEVQNSGMQPQPNLHSQPYTGNRVSAATYESSPAGLSAPSLPQNPEFGALYMPDSLEALESQVLPVPSNQETWPHISDQLYTSYPLGDPMHIMQRQQNQHYDLNPLNFCYSTHQNAENGIAASGLNLSANGASGFHNYASNEVATARCGLGMLAYDEAYGFNKQTGNEIAASGNFDISAPQNSQVLESHPGWAMHQNSEALPPNYEMGALDFPSFQSYQDLAVNQYSETLPLWDYLETVKLNETESSIPPNRNAMKPQNSEEQLYESWLNFENEDNN
ncbi:NAC domain-containing protein [Quillaja saponaria]|uniref:NAC domain-containing protein n=1 Tax=Quillaja saponaria TaxID=32244 RepID=A0AAD7Q7Y8_QUISA|nr:NAC domain-containing protein [Quillaja saponaria]